jgi:large subunit ribosomal protein L7e
MSTGKPAEKKPSALKQKCAEKIKLPFPKAENRKQREANDIARKQRRNMLARLKKTAYLSHMPAIPVPENFITFSKAKKSAVSKVLVQRAQRQLEQVHIKRLALASARTYNKEYKIADRDLIQKRRIAKQTNTFYVEAEPKVVFVIRIRGINGVSPKVRKALQLLRLRQIHNGTFVKVNGASRQILKLVEPYITFGQPNLKTVRDLVYKRGHARIGRQRIAITSNSIVHENLGKIGVHCMEDIVHELYTCGKNFKTVNSFLWPFKLSSPLGGFQKKRVHFAEGGDAGDREHYINKLVRKMN